MGILGQKGRFWTIFGQKGAIFEFSVKKRKRQFLLIFFIFQYKKSENSNTRIFGKMGTDERTTGRTEVNPKVHRLRREAKNVYTSFVKICFLKKIRKVVHYIT